MSHGLDHPLECLVRKIKPANHARKFTITSFLGFVAVLAALSVTATAQGGRIDKIFPPVMEPGADVTVIEPLSDGKLLIAGRFVTRGPVVRRDIIKLNPDGTVDPGFDAGTGLPTDVGFILAVAVQADGKILIAGYFNSFNGTQHRSVARLNANGSVDDTFNITGLDVTFGYDLALQPDGKIYLSASNLAGFSFIARFLPSGANDGGTGQQFFSISGASGYLITYLPTETKVLVTAAVFNSPNQGVVTKILPAGGQDNGFNVPVGGSPGAVRLSSLLMSSGKYLIFGSFDSIGGVPRKNIAILNQDGTVDSSFVPPASGTGTISSAAVQADGKILIGGSDFAVNGPLHGNIGRLNANGSVDGAFNAGRGANAVVKALLPNNGKLLVGGNFFRYDRAPRSGLVRVKL